mmetsp:Transcript_10156/g.17689  ORF Transcript_10156/g.17689 Transcript_10156/m.17689 type:complete len:214 (-) Transcript_10156:106-747(-)
MFLAAARIMAGPPMSIFSTPTSNSGAGLAVTVLRKGYRFTTTRSIGLILCAAIAVICSSLSRTARIPPCTAGCRVFTRPSNISGKPVTSSTLAQGTPICWIVVAVPPVLMISQPCDSSPFTSSSRLVLSDTEMSARLEASMTMRAPRCESAQRSEVMLGEKELKDWLPLLKVDAALKACTAASTGRTGAIETVSCTATLLLPDRCTAVERACV